MNALDCIEYARHFCDREVAGYRTPDDDVELCMEVRDRFGVELTLKEAGKVRDKWDTMAGRKVEEKGGEG